MTSKVIAKVPFTYMKQVLERGEIFNLRNSPRDEQLLGLRYLILFNTKEHYTNPCDGCGKKFASPSSLNAHRKKENCLAPGKEITDSESRELVAHAANTDVGNVVVGD